MLLIGAVPQPITSAPLVVAIYLVLVLMIASALASVLLRSTLYAVGAYSATMALVGLFYLLLGAPILLFALQLLVFTTVSAALLVGLLRRTGIDRSAATALRPDWIAGAGVAAALLALLIVVLVATTTWPVKACCAIPLGFAETLSSTYVVGLAVLVVIVASAALGAGLLLATPRAASRTQRVEPPGPERGQRRPRDRRK